MERPQGHENWNVGKKLLKGIMGEYLLNGTVELILNNPYKMGSKGFYVF